MADKKCAGWWEQSGRREEMEGLRMTISGNQLSGSGYDVIGPFTFDGTLDENNDVRMIKEYLGKHRVLYKGEYDGKDLMWGIWMIGFSTGPWEIKFGADKEDEETEKKKETEVIRL